MAVLGAQAKAVAVHLPADPLDTVAPSAGAVIQEFAAGGVTGTDGKQHGTPTSEVRLPAGTNSVKEGATYKSHTKTCVQIDPER